MSRSSAKSRFKVLIVGLDGAKYSLVVNDVSNEHDYVTVNKIKLAISENVDLARRNILDHSHGFELYDKDFEEFVVVGSTTVIENHSKLRVVKRLCEALPAPDNQTLSSGDLPTVLEKLKTISIKTTQQKSRNVVDQWNRDNVPNEESVAPSPSGSHTTLPSVSSGDITNCDKSSDPTKDVKIVESGISSTSTIQGKQLLIEKVIALTDSFGNAQLTKDTVWNLVAQELCKLNFDENGPHCRDVFQGLVGSYVNCLLGNMKVEDWPFFITFHEILDLNAMLSLKQMVTITDHRNRFLKSCSRQILTTPNKKFPPIECDPQIIASVLRSQTWFSSSNENNFWTSVAIGLLSKGFGTADLPSWSKYCENRFAFLVETYVSTMSLDVIAKSHDNLEKWSYFNQFHNLLNLPRLLPPETNLKISKLRSAWESINGAKVASQSGNLEKSVQHVTLCTGQYWTDLLNLVVKFEDVLVMNGDAGWQLIADMIAKLGHKEKSAKLCCEQFTGNLVGDYKQAFRIYKNAKKAQKNWPYFDCIHRLKLHLLLTPTSFKKVLERRSLWTQVQNSNQTSEGQSTPLVELSRITQTELASPSTMAVNSPKQNTVAAKPSCEIKPEDCWDRPLLVSVVKYQASFSPEHELAYWTLVASDLRSKVGSGDLQARIKLCKERFAVLLETYCLKLLLDLTSTKVNKLKNWTHFEMFHYEINLTQLLPKRVNYKIQQLRSSWTSLIILVSKERSLSPEEAEQVYSDLLELVARYQTAIINNAKVGWKIVAKELSDIHHIPNFTDGDAVTKFQHFVTLYENALKKYKSCEEAQADWKLFGCVHRLKLELLLPDKSYKSVLMCRERWASNSTEANSSLGGSLAIKCSVQDKSPTNTPESKSTSAVALDYWFDLVQLVELHQDFIIKNGPKVGWEMVSNKIREIGHKKSANYDGDLCHMHFKTCVDHYKCALKTCRNVKDAQEHFPVYWRLHRFKLDLLVPNLYPSIVKLRNIFYGTPAQPQPLAANRKAKRDAASEDAPPETHLFPLVRIRQSEFANAQLEKSLVWNLIADDLEVHQINWTGSDCQQKFNEHIGMYISALNQSDSGKKAALVYIHFKQIHKKLNLEVVCDKKQMDVIKLARESYAKRCALRALAENVHKLSLTHLTTVQEGDSPNQQQSLATGEVIKMLTDERTEFLNCIRSKMNAADVDMDKAWENVSNSMSAKGYKNFSYSSGALCRNPFEVLVGNFIDRLKTSDDLDNGCSRYEFFDQFFSDSGLRHFFEPEQFTVVDIFVKLLQSKVARNGNPDITESPTSKLDIESVAEEVSHTISTPSSDDF